MGKRKGRNKKKKLKVFNQKKFRNVYCSQCALCDSKSKPEFCFTSIYKANPELFTMGVFPNLISAAEGIIVSGSFPSNMPMTTFSQIFCETGVCTGGSPSSAFKCPSGFTCHDCFTHQVRLIQSKSKIKNKKKKKKRRQVYTPYASFFCRNDEKFKREIEKILYGDIDNKQDKDKELSGGSSGNSD